MEVCAGVGVVADHHEKQEHLHAEAYQVAYYNTQRHNEARKVDLAENVGVVSKHRAGFGEAVGKVVPGGDAGHIEERLRKSVGTQSCQITKNKRENNSGKQGLDKKPERP